MQLNRPECGGVLTTGLLRVELAAEEYQLYSDGCVCVCVCGELWVQLVAM